MLTFFAENIANILIILALGVVVALIVAHFIRNKKKGKTSCGCGCGNCPMSDACHSKSK